MLEHTSLLLSDVAHQCGWQQRASLGGAAAPAEAAALEAAGQAAQLQRHLGELQVTFDEVSDGLLYLCCAGVSGDLLSAAAAVAVSADGRPINAYDLLLNTAQLDAVVKAVGHAQFALMQAMHK